MKVVFLLAFIGISAAQWDPHFAPNQTAIVHLFEWTWNEIAFECEQFLDPMGYGGVQVSPVTENAIVKNAEHDRPWWERYQPVSYFTLTTRSGTEEQFADMVKRCNAVGVRVYVDAVINHMTGKGMKGVGTGGSEYDATEKRFPHFSPPDFNYYPKCPTGSGDIEHYDNENEVRNCNLQGLLDLNQETPYVRDIQTGLLNKLVGYGVAGFRVDDSKHMWPGDMEVILSRVENLSTAHGFPAGARPFIYQEVIEAESEPIKGDAYFKLGRVTEFKFGVKLGKIIRKWDGCKYSDLKTWGEYADMFPDGNSLVFIDNHDNQRGHGGGGNTILTFRDSKLYKIATAFMLAHPYGVTRVMSSFHWDARYDWIGPPKDENDNIRPIIRYPNNTCGNGWVCEHRWRQIYNMVEFRNVAAGSPMGWWWDNGNNQISFCRPEKGFIAINGEDDYPLNESLTTCLPAGEYCDVISGKKEGGECTGKTITVEADGQAQIYISNWDEGEDDWDPIIAIHINSKL